MAGMNMAQGLQYVKTEHVSRQLSEEELEKLYMWVDEIPLSRPKRNMTRDFSDGVLAAELIKFFLPAIVDLHNYTPSSSNRLKADNWYHLNRKVLGRLNLEITDDVVKLICACRPHVVENILCLLRQRIDEYMVNQRAAPARRRHHQQIADYRPEADQQDSRGYIPSAEGQYQDGQFHSPTSRSEDHRGLGQQGRTRGTGEMLPKPLLDEREKAIEGKEQTIQILHEKIDRLEHLLKLKDLRIEDLSHKLEQLTAPPSFVQQPQRGTLSTNRLAQRQPKRHQMLTHGGGY